eukprot:scaffold168770_cov21-Tisochrysis_lutea.AAC.5
MVGIHASLNGGVQGHKIESKHAHCIASVLCRVKDHISQNKCTSVREPPLQPEEAHWAYPWSSSSTAVDRPASPLPTMATRILGAPCRQVQCQWPGHPHLDKYTSPNLEASIFEGPCKQTQITLRLCSMDSTEILRASPQAVTFDQVHSHNSLALEGQAHPGTRTSKAHPSRPPCSHPGWSTPWVWSLEEQGGWQWLGWCLHICGDTSLIQAGSFQGCASRPSVYRCCC